MCHSIQRRGRFCWFPLGSDRNFEEAKDSMIDSRGQPYDYGSIMHYSKYSGNNRPGLITIKAKDPTAEIGQRKSPSKGDITQARLMYGCGGKFT